jgi:P pilus assembly chaperone PapD
MKVNKALLLTLAGLVLLTLLVGPVLAQQKPSLDSWKPAFDPSGAKYKFTVSNVSNPPWLIRATIPSPMPEP